MSLVITEGSSSTLYSSVGSDKYIDGSIYKFCSDTIKLSSIIAPSYPRNEIELFLDKAVKHSNGITQNAEFIALNSFLGSIGVTETYPTT